jgi:hypothetical protein
LSESLKPTDDFTLADALTESEGERFDDGEKLAVGQVTTIMQCLLGRKQGYNSVKSDWITFFEDESKNGNFESNTEFATHAFP